MEVCYHPAGKRLRLFRSRGLYVKVTVRHFVGFKTGRTCISQRAGLRRDLDQRIITRLRMQHVNCAREEVNSLNTRNCIQFGMLNHTPAMHSLATLYFRKSHNPSFLPSKILHNHCLLFLLGHEHVPREIENNA